MQLPASGRARRALTLAVWLACTAASIAVFRDPAAAVDTDEVYWLGQTYYYHLAFEAREWRHPDWNLIPSRENPPGAKYVLGAGVALQGFHIASLDLLGSFYSYYDANLGRHPARAAAQDSVLDRMTPQFRRLVGESRQMYFEPELVLSGRRVALLCAIVTSLLVFFLGTAIAGARTGLVASQLFLLHPGVIGAYEHAMADAPAFMFGTAAALGTWLLARQFTGHPEPLTSHPERSEGSAVALAALVGALLGLAVSAKLNWVIVAFLFGAVWTFLAAQAWRRNDRARARRAVAIGSVGLVTSLAVFIMIDPAILFDPVHNLMTPVRELRQAAKVQAALLPNPPFLATLGMRLTALTSLVFGTPWAFALGLAAIAAACVKAPRPGVWFVAAWWIIAFVAVSAWIPFEWPRYALPLTIPSVLLAAHLVVVSAAALNRRFAPVTSDVAGDRFDRRELLTFMAGLAALYAIIILVSDGQVLFTRPLWVDEVWTLLLSGSGSPVDVIASLAQGGDGGAGLVHLGAWLLQKLVGVPSPGLLRTLSLACVFSTLCGVYVLLRRRFSQDASIAGALAVGSHALVVTHTFEARFYGPWLLICAALALGLSRHAEGPTRRSAVLVGVTSFLMCTVHFYGVLTLALMSAGAMAAYGRRWRESLRLLTPVAIGGAAGVLLIAPLAISLRSAVSATWVPEFSPRQLRALALQFWSARVPLFAAVFLVIGILGRGRFRSMQPVETVARAFLDPGIAALTALAIVPLVMATMSLLGQPSMLFRYNITTVLAWGPFVALAMDVVRGWPARLARVALVVLWFQSFVNVRFEKIVFAGDVAEMEEAIQRGRAQNAPIVFQSVHSWYPVWQRDRSLGGSTGFLEMSDATLERLFRPGTTNEMLNRGLALDRDLVRVHTRRFGVPRLVPEAVLDTTSRFVFVASWAHLPVGFRSIERFSQSVFPDHRVTRIDLNSALLERIAR